MKFTIVSGSHRNNSQSIKVSRYIEYIIKKRDVNDEVYVLELTNNPIPLWDEDKRNLTEKWKNIWGTISLELQSSQAIIIVSPEWGGMVPAGLKNFFLMCNNKELFHKPGLIVTVSASYGGSYPVAELRMSSYKNTHLNYIPEQVIIRQVRSKLNDYHIPESEDDQVIRDRLSYAIDLLIEYGKALLSVRTSNVFKNSNYPHGM